MFERFFLSADLGDGSGGGDPGGGAAVADSGVDAGVQDAGQQAQFDYEGFAKQYGGPEGLKRAVEFASDIQNRAHYNPQFKEHLERALRGEFGQQAQQEAQQQQAQGRQQQQGGGESWLKYEPATLAQMQSFHQMLDRARYSGDPDAVKAVMEDPANAQAREAYQKHQNEMNNAYWNPRDHYNRLWSDPENKQAREQEIQQAITAAVQPLQQELAMYQKTAFYERNQKAIDALPQHIKEAFGRGVFGEIDSARGWISAVQVAMQEAQKLQATGQTQNSAVAGGATEQQRVPNHREPTNGVKREGQPKEGGKSAASKYAEDMRKARQLDKS